jgi:hypothetical protein
MPLNVSVLETWTWPWPVATLHMAYLMSGLLIALHYVPQLQRAWCFPAATLAAQSLSTWSVWTLCRAVAFIYGLFVLHDLVFLLVVGADMFGRLGMVVLIVRAHAIAARITLIEDRVPNNRTLKEPAHGESSCCHHRYRTCYLVGRLV